MANVHETVGEDGGGERIAVGPPPWLAFVNWLMRAVVRLWIVGMLALAAAFGGIAVYQFYQMRAELNEERAAPGPQAYAVIAYRRELERQLEAYERNSLDWDTVPAPPPRPRLMEEIDLARLRNAELRRDAERRRVAGGRGLFAPP